jgi:hypothetical protein
MLMVSLWLLRLGRKLVGDVLRVFPGLGHEPGRRQQNTTVSGRVDLCCIPVVLRSRKGIHGGKHSLGMAAAGNELFLLVREADRSVREGLADCNEEETHEC